MLKAPVRTDDPTVPMLDRLRLWWAICGLVLFAATWRLWVPQSVFPQVPLFHWVTVLPNAFDGLCFGSLIVALIAAAIGLPRYARTQIAWPLFSVTCVGSVLFDQHRLQPWVWLLLLMSLLFQDDSSRRTLQVRWFETLSPETLLRWLTISVYFWSAVSKFDQGFFATHGPTLVEALLRLVGLGGLPGSVTWGLAIGLPFGELLIAVGLSCPRFRRYAVWGAIGLHFALILALGPLGLGHRSGVLLWNIAFIGHDWLLFRPSTSTDPRHGRSLQETPMLNNELKSKSCKAPALADAASCLLRSYGRPGIVMAAVLWPITEPFGICDHWLAWSVYSTRTERVTVTLTTAGTRRLPEAAQRLVKGSELPLDRWSLESLNVPIYPQLRFQLGIVEWLQKRCGEENVLEVTVVLPGSRLKGDITTEFVPSDQISQRLEHFWINTRPKTE